MISMKYEHEEGIRVFGWYLLGATETKRYSGESL